MVALRLGFCALVVAIALASSPALARDYALKELRIVEPYARATAPGARTGGAYFKIENRGAANDALVGVASPVAETAELHVMRIDGKLAQMRPISRIGLPGGAIVTLAPNGYHVMLIGLKRPLVAGDTLPLKLTFEKAGSVEIEASIIPLTATAPPAHAHPQ